MNRWILILFLLGVVANLQDMGFSIAGIRECGQRMGCGGVKGISSNRFLLEKESREDLSIESSPCNKSDLSIRSEGGYQVTLMPENPNPEKLNLCLKLSNKELWSLGLRKNGEVGNVKNKFSKLVIG